MPNFAQKDTRHIGAGGWRLHPKAGAQRPGETLSKPEACNSTGVNGGNGAAALDKSDNIAAKTITPSG